MAKKKKKKEKTSDKQTTNSGRDPDGKFNESWEGQFKPGVSGNLAGRPPKRDIRKVFEDLLDVKIKYSKTDRRVLDELADAILKHAISGNAQYMRELLDRTYGKVVQQVEVAESRTFVRQTDPERKNNDSDSESGE